MATEEQDSFLAMIEAKIAALQALAESYRTALSVGALGQLVEMDQSVPSPAISGGTHQNGAAPADLPIGVFRDKSIPDAIKLFLAAQRRKQTAKEITAGLLAGGLVSTSIRFDTSVGTGLHRLKAAGVVLRFQDGWDLAESYPEHLRSRIANSARTSKPKPKPKKTVKRRRGRPQSPHGKRSGGGFDERLLEYMQSRPTGETPSGESISLALHSDVRVVTMGLGRLAKKGTVTKHQDGQYSAVGG